MTFSIAVVDADFFIVLGTIVLAIGTVRSASWMAPSNRPPLPRGLDQAGEVANCINCSRT
jgi:hypothetical protein